MPAPMPTTPSILQDDIEPRLPCRCPASRETCQLPTTFDHDQGPTRRTLRKQDLRDRTGTQTREIRQAYRREPQYRAAR